MAVNINDKKTEYLEDLYSRRKTPQIALALAQRYYLGYRLAQSEIHLKKSYHVVAAALDAFPSMLDLRFMRIMLELELDDTSAREHLQELKPYRGKLKNDSPLDFGMLSFLEVLYNIRSDKGRAANKGYSKLNDYARSYDLPQLYPLLAWLDIEFGEYGDAYIHLQNTWRANNGYLSSLVFTLMYEVFNELDAVTEDDVLLMPFTGWASSHGADISYILKKYSNFYTLKIPSNLRLFKRLYQQYPEDWLLEGICRAMAGNLDLSAEAHRYYSASEAKQIYPPRHNYFLVHSAYRNGIERLGRHAISTYLEQNDQAQEILPFLYYILLSRPDYADLAEKYRNQIMQLGFYCLENKLRGRYYYNIYCFVLESALAQHQSFKREPLFAIAAELLAPLLFAYDIEIPDPNIKAVWIYEPEKKEGAGYAVSGKSDRGIRITAAGDDFRCIFFGEGMRNIIDTPLKVKRVVAQLTPELMIAFLNAGMDSPDLMITLSRHYMNVLSDESTELPSGCVEVFRRTLAISSLSRGFRVRIQAALGDYYARIGEFTRACSYYRDADANLLDDDAVERMLLAYVNSGDLESANNIVSSKSMRISERSLFYALKQLSAQGRYHRSIAAAAYGLLLNNWYDKTLVEVVIECYNGSQREWQALSRALSSMNVQDESLQRRILDNGARIRDHSAMTQRTFVQLASGRACRESERYCTYLCYEIIINGFEPDRNVIDVMERLYEQKHQHFLGYALCHLYIRGGVLTQHMPAIIRRSAETCAEDGFIFPVFKEVQDKSLITPYIEKNRPFLYRSTPGKQVDLCWRVSGDAEYNATPMRYIRFGLYAAHVVHFSGETLEYYFQETTGAGSIATKAAKITNSEVRLLENSDDLYYTINNALIYQQMFKYDRVEEIINERLKERPRIKNWIL